MRPNLRKQKPVREYTSKSAAKERAAKLLEMGFTNVAIQAGFFKRFQVSGTPPKGYR